jgi:transketolase
VQEYAARCSYGITIEEHNITGGLGSAVAEVVSSAGIACRLKRLGIQEYYPKGGPLMTNRQRTGLTAEHIIETAKEFL